MFTLMLPNRVIAVERSTFNNLILTICSVLTKFLSR